MARITYGVVAGALVTLVAGFFIRSSAIPLYLSIVCSVAVVGLITTGWARRLRSEADGIDQVEVEEIEPDTMFVEVTDSFGELTAELPSLRRATQRKRKPKVKTKAPKGKAKAKATRRSEAPKRSKAPPRKKGSNSKPSASKKPSGKRVLVMPGRDRYHTASCRFASGQGAKRIAIETARRRGYEPCSACSPR